jgi:hypothetical protein
MPRNSNQGFNMDSSKPFLPHTFPDPGYAGFKVTVSGDRSIKVRQGDWLSKYSMAIYGDFDHIDKFRRKDGAVYVKVTDKDLIKTGEILYHPDPLPGETSIPPGEGTGGSEPPVQASYVAEFFQWIKQTFVSTEWTVAGNGGVDFNVFFAGVGYATLGMQDIEPRLDPSQPPVRWYHAISSGFVYGWPTWMPVGGSFSVVQFPSGGRVLKPLWSSRLTFNDFRGGIVVVSAGFNIVGFVGGGSATAILFGIGGVPRLLAGLDRFFRYGDRAALETSFLMAAGTGVALIAGLSIGIPGAGVAVRAGFMIDSPAHWRQQ